MAMFVAHYTIFCIIIKSHTTPNPDHTSDFPFIVLFVDTNFCNSDDIDKQGPAGQRCVREAHEAHEAHLSTFSTPSTPSTFSNVNVG